jgi:hypothetical protein
LFLIDPFWRFFACFFRRTTRGEVSAEPRKKHSLDRTLKTRAISNGLAAPVATPRPQTWQARAWGGQRPTAPPSREKNRLGREFGWAVRTAVRTTATIIVWARETGRAAPLRRNRREGLQAVGQAGKAPARTAGYGSRLTERTQPPKRGRAGRAGAGASASANAGLHAGVNAGHTMRDACGPHNSGRMQTCEQTGRWDRQDRSCVQRHLRPHGHGQGMDTATSSDFSASLVGSPEEAEESLCWRLLRCVSGAGEWGARRAGAPTGGAERPYLCVAAIRFSLIYLFNRSVFRRFSYKFSDPFFPELLPVP